MTGRAPLIALLVMLGIGWGVTQPLAKIAVSEGYRHFGLVFWQLAIGAVALGIVSAVRRKGLPMTGAHLRFYALIALIGTVLPNSASFKAAVHLPAGVMSIVISLVPMFAFPIALLLATTNKTLMLGCEPCVVYSTLLLHHCRLLRQLSRSLHHQRYPLAAAAL